jgi:hypothetical protein
MGEAIITRRSAGVGADAFAFIVVTYSGGTCTCTNGSKTLTHSGGGVQAFGVDQAGTWTVTATETYTSDTKTVTISQKGEIKEITLTYTYTLFNNGVVNNISWVTAGNSSCKVGSTLYLFANHNYSGGTKSLAAISTANKIDLTNYKTLYFTVSSASCSGTSYYNYSRGGVSSNTGEGSTASNAGSFSTYSTICGRGDSFSSSKTISVDIKGYGSMHVKIAGEANDNGISGTAQTIATITKVWATS